MNSLVIVEQGTTWSLEAGPDFDSFPPRITHGDGGYVYCVEMEKGLVRVGRSINPASRIRCHYNDAVRLSAGALRVWISPAHREFDKSERSLLSHLSSVATRQQKTETFKGSDLMQEVRHWWTQQDVRPPGLSPRERKQKDAAWNELQDWLLRGIRPQSVGAASTPDAKGKEAK